MLKLTKLKKKSLPKLSIKDTKKNERTSEKIKEELKLKLQKLLFDQC